MFYLPARVQGFLTPFKSEASISSQKAAFSILRNHIQQRSWRIRCISSSQPSSQNHYETDGLWTDADDGDAGRTSRESTSSPNNFRRRFRWNPPTKSFQAARLGVDVLGKPAEILILRDEQRHKRETQSNSTAPPSSESLPNQISSSELLQTIEAERGIINQAKVFANIENLRRSILKQTNEFGLTVATKYRDFASKVHDGFTVTQLQNYIDSEPPVSFSTNETFLDAASTTLYTRSPWVKGKTPFPERALSRLHPSGISNKKPEAVRRSNANNDLKRPTKKNSLVEQILRQIWRIRVKAEEESIGELDARLQPGHLKLLLLHNNTILANLSKRYGAKIDISNSRNVIRLTADYSTCCDLFKIIEFVLEKIRVEVKELHLPLPDEQDSKNSGTINTIIDTIGQLTGTFIKSKHLQSGPNSRPVKFWIYYLGPATADLEDAQRLLARSIGKAPDYHSKSFHMSSPESFPKLSPVEVGSMVPMADRERRWSRWISTNQDSDISQSQSKHNREMIQLINNAIREVLCNPQSVGANSETTLSLGPHWNNQVSQSISATICCLLYPESMDQPAFSNGPNAFALDIKSRGLVTNVPTAYSTLNALNAKLLERKEEICIRLDPIQSTVFDDCPTLNLHVTVDQQSKTTFLSAAKLIVREQEADLLLPEQLADVRFVNQTYILSSQEIDHRLSEFIENSNLEVWGRERLRTPSSLKLAVPKSILGAANKKRKEESQGDESSRDIIDYAFSSMDHKSHIFLTWGGFQLAYTVVEAGKIGGRREELRLSMTRPDQQVLRDKDNTESPSVAQLDSFFESVQRLVRNTGERKQVLKRKSRELLKL